MVRPRRVPKILRKFARNNLCPLATIPCHECGQRGYICTQNTAQPHPNLRKVRSATATLLRRNSQNFSFLRTPLNRGEEESRGYSMPQPYDMPYRKWRGTLISYYSELATPAHRDTIRCQSP